MSLFICYRVCRPISENHGHPVSRVHRVRQCPHDCSLRRAHDPGRPAPTRPRAGSFTEGHVDGLHDGRRRSRDERGRHVRGAVRGLARSLRSCRRGRGRLRHSPVLGGRADSVDGPRRGPRCCLPRGRPGGRGRARRGRDGACHVPRIAGARRILDHRAPERSNGGLNERAARRGRGADCGRPARARRRGPHRRASSTSRSCRRISRRR